MSAIYIPYCGTPPTTADWLLRWNLDPLLLVVLAGIAVAYEIALRRADERGGHACGSTSRLAFRAGLGLLALGLVSPLCALSVALFSARVTQHVLLLFIAVPLVVYSKPLDLLGGVRRTGVRSGPFAGLALSTLVFTALFWLWHAPGFYAATFTSTAAYWAMHLSLLGGATLFWSAVLETTRAGAGHDVARLASPLAVAGVFAQMGLLGALLTLAPRLLYSPHVTTTMAFGLTALEDQQLGGLIMWVPGGLSLLVIGLLLARSLTLADVPSGGAA